MHQSLEGSLQTLCFFMLIVIPRWLPLQDIVLHRTNWFILYPGERYRLLRASGYFVDKILFSYQPYQYYITHHSKSRNDYTICHRKPKDRQWNFQKDKQWYYTNTLHKKMDWATQIPQALGWTRVLQNGKQFLLH